MNKRGVSPVIATILLIAIVIILAIIIFLWARGFVAEKAEKEGRAVELSCGDTNFEPGVFCEGDDCDLEVVNNGNVPLYGFEIKELGTGSLIVKEILTSYTVTIGDSIIISLDDFDSGDVGKELIVIPVILGETNDGVKIAHTCTDQYGFRTSALAV